MEQCRRNIYKYRKCIFIQKYIRDIIYFYKYMYMLTRIYSEKPQNLAARSYRYIFYIFLDVFFQYFSIDIDRYIYRLIE